MGQRARVKWLSCSPEHRALIPNAVGYDNLGGEAHRGTLSGVKPTKHDTMLGAMTAVSLGAPAADVALATMGTIDTSSAGRSRQLDCGACCFEGNLYLRHYRTTQTRRWHGQRCGIADAVHAAANARRERRDKLIVAHKNGFRAARRHHAALRWRQQLPGDALVHAEEKKRTQRSAYALPTFFRISASASEAGFSAFLTLISSILKTRGAKPGIFGGDPRSP